MKANHGSIVRNNARAWLLAGALCGLSLSAYAANSSNIGRASVSRNGNVTSVGPGANAGGSTIPVSPNVGGWTQAGNYGVPPGATNPTMGHVVNGEFVVGGSAGVKYPFQGAYSTPWKDVAVGALQVTGTMGCSLVTSGVGTALCAATVPLAVPYIYDWITKSGGRFNPENGRLEMKDPKKCFTGPCYTYTANISGGSSPPLRTPWNTQKEACIDRAVGEPGYRFWSDYYLELAGTLEGTPNTCKIIRYTNSSYSTIMDTYGLGLTVGTRAPDTPGGTDWIPASMDDIAPYMGIYKPDGRVVGEILSRGGEVPLSAPTVSGPSVIQGPETTKQNADGSKEVSRTTYNFTTAGNTVTNTTNSTTTNNFNAAGAQTSTTTTTTNNNGAGTPAGDSEPAQTDCDKYPNALGCIELGDIEKTEIPKDTKTITFAAEERLSGGSCPANKSWSIQTTGTTVASAVDWAFICDAALPLRGMIMALAAFIALVIVMPGGGVKTD